MRVGHGPSAAMDGRSRAYRDVFTAGPCPARTLRPLQEHQNLQTSTPRPMLKARAAAAFAAFEARQAVNTSMLARLQHPCCRRSRLERRKARIKPRTSPQPRAETLAPRLDRPLGVARSRTDCGQGWPQSSAQGRIHSVSGTALHRAATPSTRQPHFRPHSKSAPRTARRPSPRSSPRAGTIAVAGAG